MSQTMTDGASPVSTGGGGFNFEHKVQAAFTVAMLVNGRLPCLPDGTVDSIRLQSGDLGYKTDDMLVLLREPTGTTHRLLAQIKRDMTFANRDDDFVKSLQGAWADYHNRGLFQPDKDVIVFITGPGSKKEIRHIRPLLEWARTSVSGGEYVAKVNVSGSSSRQKQTYLQTMRNILQAGEQSDISDDALWVFLKRLYWLEYDLDVQDGQSLAHLKALIRIGKVATSTESDDALWARILEFVAGGDENAATLTLSSINPSITEHFQRGVRPLEAISTQRLRDHSEAALQAIRDRFPDGTHLDRSRIVSEIMDALWESQAVIVRGSPGVGKSAIVKALATELSARFPVFMLKADEMDRPHVDAVLSDIRINEPLPTISARFGLLETKVLIVDAMEKLLEASNQDTFCQFLQFIHNDPSWYVVLTCRSYAVGFVREQFLLPAGVFCTLKNTPPLSNEELRAVVDTHPQLAVLTSNPKLAEVLRIPMYLSHACTVQWPVGAAVQQLTVPEFKDLLWQRVIEKDSQQGDGIHLRRGRAFQDIAVRRAKRMTLAVSLEREDDAEAVQALIADELLDRSGNGVAPIHDLFEDWALERHVGAAFTRNAQQPAEFFADIGPEPATRRSFRRWLVSSLAEVDPDPIARFVSHVVLDEEIPAFWRDETLVAVLSSSHAPQYFASQKTALLADEKKLFVRIIHLLRTACKQPNERLLKDMPMTDMGRDIFGLMFLTPGGPGWAAIIGFIHENISAFSFREAPLISAMLQDWVGNVTSGDDLPAEARPSGLIALAFFWSLVNLYDDDGKRDLLRVAFRVADVISPEIQSLVQTATGLDEDSFRSMQTVRETALESFYGGTLCQALPEEVAAIARRHWLLPDDPYRRLESFSTDIPAYFGLLHDYGFHFHPASALQGPFFYLLIHHPEVGVSLILDLVNHATEQYSGSSLDHETPGAPIQLTVQMNDGTSVTQWGCARLWLSYRGMHVSPGLLQSALMALENWLLRECEESRDIRPWFNRLLRESNSVAITAVLTSTAIAYRDRLGVDVLPLLRVREFYEWETARQVGEQQLVVDIGALMGIPEQADKKIHTDERQRSKERSHRVNNLEWLALNLQFSDLQQDVANIIDEFLAELPSIADQTDSHRVWRIALHRMDRRNYDQQLDEEGTHVLFMPKPPDEDIQVFQARNQPQLDQFFRFSSLLNWAVRVFRHEVLEEDSYPNWRDALAVARKAQQYADEHSDDGRIAVWSGAPAYVASICVRDHKVELEQGDLQWCVETISDAVTAEMNNGSDQVRVSRHFTDGSRPSAYVLPCLLGIDDPDFDHAIRLLIAGALTHASEEVRGYAIAGIGELLAATDPEFVHTCLNGLIEMARIRQEEMRRSRSTWDGELDGREQRQAEVDDWYRQALEGLRDSIAEQTLGSDLDGTRFSLDNYSTFELMFALHLVDLAANDTGGILLNALLREMLRLAKEDESARDRRDRHFEFEHLFTRVFMAYVLKQTTENGVRLCAPIAESMRECPEFSADLFDSLIGVEDKIHSGEKFWTIWSLLATKAFTDEFRERDPRLLQFGCNKLIRSLLLVNVTWKDKAQEWTPLRDHPSFLADAFEKVGHWPIGFESYLRLFYSIGRPYLPNGFLWLASAMELEDQGIVFADSTNRFVLESLLRNYICMNATTIRRDMAMRAAIIRLLDRLIDTGSSVAFQLRERVITPPPGRADT